MEANSENPTSQNLSIVFVSSDVSPSKTLQIALGQTKFFQEAFDIGSTLLEPSLVEYDAVIIKNQSEVILKMYQENDTGKKIYNINEYWTASEPSKRFFKYKYEIVIENID